MMTNKLYIAAAGSGKTHRLIEEATEKNNKKVLILSYTIKNNEEIIKRVKNKFGIIPNNIKIDTWFSFLLNEGIKPYQGIRFKKKIRGILFKNNIDRNFSKKSDNNYFITEDNLIFSNKLSECVCELNKLSKDRVISRIAKLYDCIYIDEVQDFVGYDLEIFKLFMKQNIKVIMFGDPRQCTFRTHQTIKYRKYQNGKIDQFIFNECKKLQVIVDDETLNYSYRNNNKICDLANCVFTDTKHIQAKNIAINKDEGIFQINNKDIERYLQKYNAVQLRYNKKTDVNENFKCYNFGESKGLEFDRVLIYPTNDMWSWLKNKDSTTLKDEIKSKLYVAITRARYSVVFVKKDNLCDMPEVDLNY